MSEKTITEIANIFVYEYDLPPSVAEVLVRLMAPKIDEIVDAVKAGAGYDPNRTNQTPS